MLRGLNHLTLAVSDLQRSLAFYSDVLGIAVATEWDKGAYLECGELWLCLSLDSTRQYVAPEDSDYTHYAFSVSDEDFDDFVARLDEKNVPIWKENVSEGKSRYFLDPDGHKLEAHVGGLNQRLASLQKTDFLEEMWEIADRSGASSGSKKWTREDIYEGKRFDIT